MMDAKKSQQGVDSTKMPLTKRWWFWPVVIFLGLGVIGNMIPESSEQKAEREASEQKATLAKKLEDEAKAAKVLADKAAGFHCLSAWDGSHQQLVQAVKAALRNPKSYEHIETRISAIDTDGYHSLAMRYRAENGFGGMNVESVTAKVKNEDCSVSNIMTNR